jgi:hypothetical protein
MKKANLGSIALCLLLAGCSEDKDAKKELNGSHSVAKLCSGTTQVRLSAVSNYLVHSIKDENDPQFAALFQEFALGSDGNLDEGLSLEDCRVAPDGSLSLTAKNGKGASKSFTFATKGKTVIALSTDVSRPASSETNTCQQDTLTFYTLSLSDEFAAYVESPADKDYALDFAQTADAEVFSDASCKTPSKTINFPKNSKTLPVSFRVAEGKRGTLTFSIVGLTYGDTKAVQAPAPQANPSEPVSESDARAMTNPGSPNVKASTPMEANDTPPASVSPSANP